MYYIYVIKTDGNNLLEGVSLFSEHNTLEEAQEYLQERKSSLNIYYSGYFIHDKELTEALGEKVCDFRE